MLQAIVTFLFFRLWTRMADKEFRILEATLCADVVETESQVQLYIYNEVQKILNTKTICSIYVIYRFGGPYRKLFPRGLKMAFLRLRANIFLCGPTKTVNNLFIFFSNSKMHPLVCGFKTRAVRTVSYGPLVSQSESGIWQIRSKKKNRERIIHGCAEI